MVRERTVCLASPPVAPAAATDTRTMPLDVLRTEPAVPRDREPAAV